MPNGKKTQVRHYVTPSDSANIVDFLVDYFNRSDIPELYSEQVAGIPVKEEPGLYTSEGATASFDRYLSGDELKRKEITFDPDEEAKGYGRIYVAAEKYPDTVSKDIRFRRTPRNTMLHEAFGHGLLDAVYGYQKKPHFSRIETFPYMVQVYSEILRMKEEGIPESDPYYKKHLDAFEELKKMSTKQLGISKD